MDKRQETNYRLNELTCVALGKLAHVEDMIEVATEQAESLLVDIAKHVERAS